MKRAGIYFFYDKDGIVDSYVPYFIDGLHEVVDYIVVVVNGKLTADGRKILSSCADDLFVRENVGFDAWAYKDAIEYISWEKLLQYDELVLANFTMFGPIFPFRQIFEKMDTVECDFWGMVTSYERNMKDWFGVPLKWGCTPETIISNFRVYKSSVLHSFEFRTHWNTLPHIRNYFESNVYHEMELSKMLSDAGFIMVAADRSELERDSPSASVYGAFKLIEKYQIPVIRIKAFFDPNGTLDFCSNVPQKMIHFIENCTGYDVNLIWEHLLRTVNQYDLKNWMNWNRILPSEHLLSSEVPSERVAVIFHVYYMDIMEKYFHNIESFSENTDFYFTTDTQEKQTLLQTILAPYSGRYHIQYRKVENRGRDVSALLVACRDIVLSGKYDLICFMHEKKGIGNPKQFAILSEAFSDCCFENVAPTKEYVRNVIHLFHREPRLGIAVPPPPQNGDYYKVIGGFWGKNYKNVETLLGELHLQVPLDPQKPPLAPYGSVFWFRPNAVLPLFEKDWCYEDFDPEPMGSDGTISNAVERIHSLVAQAQGYYPLIIMSLSYAEQEVTRMTEIAHTYIDFTLKYVGRKDILKVATTQFSKMLQARTKPATAKIEQRTAPALVKRKQRGRLKSFVRAVCPIGLWNVIRRLKCIIIGGKYVETKVHRSPFKSLVRACMPRFLWDLLRKEKCKENGWVFVED